MKHSLKQAGMVLLTTVMMIMMMSLLILALMQSVLLYIKASNEMVKKHQELYELEDTANKLLLSQNTLITNACMVKNNDPNHVIQLLLKQKGCFISSDKQYLIADLGSYPCLQIISGQVAHGSHHWLLSVVSSHRPHAVLQVRISTPTINSEVCESPTRFRKINPGVISWRYV